ncbi:MAG: RNA polymerase sigma factor [Candidatus Cyclobacteriaceae bacterium M2_1C_046]
MSEQPEENVCEEKVFNYLFEKLSKDLYRFLYYKYGEANSPHDLVQEAFLKLWNNCSKVAPEKARSFLFTVASNQVLNEISKKKTALNYSKEKVKHYTHESPEYVLEENEYMSRLQSALEDLSEEQRVTFLLNRVEGKKHQEIADMLGISRKAVEKRIYTALRILKEKVEGL